MSRYSLIFVVSLLAAALVAAPAADGGKRKLRNGKLFRVALSGKATVHATKWQPLWPPPGCDGVRQGVSHLTGSFRIRPVRASAVITTEWGVEAMTFAARTVSRKYSYRRDESGQWSRDQTLGFDPQYNPDPNPNACATTPERNTRLSCTWRAGMRSRRGAVFTLHPVGRRYNLGFYNALSPELSCQRNTTLSLIGRNSVDRVKTKLRQAAVERLARGKRVRVADTVVLPQDDDYGGNNDDGYLLRDRGRERLKYTLTVKRIR